jgi:hypothetical protein
VLSQQLQGELQTQHSAVIGNYIMDKQHNVKDKLQEHINAEKQTNMVGNDHYKRRTLSSK